MAIHPANKNIAVITRDGNSEVLVHIVSRSPKGDVYVNWPLQDEPHASYHASGQNHNKTGGWMSKPILRQKPDKNFTGTEQVVAIPLVGDPLTIKSPHNSADYVDVFEIPISAWRPDGRVQIAFDLAAPGSPPFARSRPPSSTTKVLAEFESKDAVPYILVTLYDTGQEQSPSAFLPSRDDDGGICGGSGSGR